MEPELALALSTRDWTDHLHRFLADHGGARVRVNAIGPDDLLAEGFHILLIDDICSFLTPRLVTALEQSGRAVIGVYDPKEAESGRTRLLEAGITATVASSAEPESFLEVIRAAIERLDWPPQSMPPPQTASEAFVASGLIAVGGPPGGAGSTEVAIAMAVRLAEAGERVALLDLDHQCPAIAQRLALPLHPNLLTALDSYEHRPDQIAAELLAVGRPAFWVLPGAAAEVGWSRVKPYALTGLLKAISAHFDRVILNLGPVQDPGPVRGGAPGPISSAVLSCSDRLVAVGAASPIGLTRLIDWLAVVEPSLAHPADVVLNQSPRDAKRKADLVSELVRSYRPASLATAPFDPEVVAAAWDGRPVTKGRYKRAVDAWIEETFGAIHG